MKRISLLLMALFCLLALAAVSFGETLHAPQGMPAQTKLEATNTLLSAVTATPTTGTAVDLGQTATEHLCVITTGGTAPTSVTVTAYTSVDGTNYATLTAHTYTVATTDTQGFKLSYPSRYIKASYDSKVGGAADTAVTLKCVSVK